ncbi:hypothetical protein R3P38DRAFT_3179580 [Favolaschia claudopus]|uniref:DUF6697 domain-containing protein n=1 Tax=Favolaschia claudopus TaxID=2862362 RepID=A0AAW0CPR9_9AGAR
MLGFSHSRDDAQTRCTAAQTKIAELEHREIEDLRSEIGALKEAAEVAATAQRIPSAKPIQAPPSVPVNLIEISDDDEDDVGVVGGSAGKKDSKARLEATSASEMSDIIQIQDPAKNRPQSRQIMDHVSIPRRSSQSPLKSRASSTLQSNEDNSSRTASSRTESLSTPGRFKRVRSISPPIDDSTLVGDDDTVVASSSKRPSRDIDTPVPPAKAPKKAKIEDSKDSLKDVANIYLTNAKSFSFTDDAPPNRTLLISRKFLLKQYGVLNQAFLGYFKATDGRGAVFPQPELNPFLPDKPGAPGLIFASRFEIVKDHEGMPLWRCMWGFGRGLDEAEMRERGEQVAKKGGRPLPVEAQDIVDALSRGDETIGIIKMECVLYDHGLVEDMEGRYEEWLAHAGGNHQEQEEQAKVRESDSDSDAYMSPESEDGSDEDEDGVGLLEAVRVRRREAVGRRRMVGERDEHVPEPSFGFDSDSPLTELEDTDGEVEE